MLNASTIICVAVHCIARSRVMRLVWGSFLLTFGCSAAITGREEHPTLGDTATTHSAYGRAILIISEQKSQSLLSFLAPDADLQDAALAYAANRMFVVRLQQRSKKPLDRKWQVNATTDAELIRQLWNHKPYNIGIALKLSGLAVLDIDPRNGGNETLAALVAEHGALPPTYTVRSGGDGLHYYYSMPADFDESLPQKLGPGIDLKTSGQVVVPPSRTDDFYRVVDGSPLELAPLPFKWVYAVSREQLGDKHTENFEFEEVAAVGERNDYCTRLAGLMRRFQATEGQIKAMLNGLGESGYIDEFETFKDDISTIAQSVSRYPPEAIHFADLRLQINQPRKVEPKTKTSAYYGLLGEFLEITDEYSEAHPMAILATALTMIGNIISPWIGFRAGGSWHPPLLYSMVVGHSSEGAKGQSEARVEELMRFVDPEWHENIASGLASGEGILESIADPIETGEKSKVNGKEVKHTRSKGHADKRLMLFEPEFGRVLKVIQRAGNTTLEVLLELYDREKVSKLTVERRNVTNARVSIVMHAPPVVITDLMPSDWLTNGFANRFTWIWSKRTKADPLGAPLPHIELERLGEEIASCIDLLHDRFEDNNQVPIEIGFTSRARRVWDPWYTEFSTKKYHAELDEVIARRKVQLRRMATIFAVLDGRTYIDANHLYAARALLDYSEETCVYLFGAASGDKNADKIYRLLKEHPAGLSKTELFHEFKSNITAQRLDTSLNKLLERGLIRMEKLKKPGSRKSQSVFIAL